MGCSDECPFRERTLILTRMLIALATDRHCRVCGAKIDRGHPPLYHEAAARSDGPDVGADGLWPYWQNHDSDCELRVAARALKLPDACSQRQGDPTKADT